LLKYESQENLTRASP